MAHQTIVILDFGGQYNELIAKKVRSFKVYCEIMSCKTSASEIKAKNPIGIIITGGTKTLAEAPQVSKELFTMGIPVLAVSFGCNAMINAMGGSLKPCNVERASIATKISSESKLFEGISSEISAWTELSEAGDKLPEGFKAIASSSASEFAGIENVALGLYGLQFHPEVSMTSEGGKVVKNFLYSICGATGDWSMADYAKTAVEDIRKTVGDGKVLLALSGGVDSSVCAELIRRAIGNQLTCIFVDTGLMRKNEGDEVSAYFGNKDLNYVRVNAEARYLEKLAGVTDPERKRKIIGEEFIRIFEEESKKIGKVDFLAQGTIYPDIVESGIGDAKIVKSHHNVGGLPDFVDFKEIIEPLRMLFKQEVRDLGKELGIPEYLYTRQPFPGPGLAVRCIGELTKVRLDLLRDVDFIFRDEIAKAGLDKEISQYFAVLTSMRSVGVTNDARTYDYTVALRAVITDDFMTADYAKIPYDVLDKASKRIIKECGNINRIVYDITSKPPATIEWE